VPVAPKNSLFQFKRKSKVMIKTDWTTITPAYNEQYTWKQNKNSQAPERKRKKKNCPERENPDKT
jgi:hypothetical protein